MTWFEDLFGFPESEELVRRFVTCPDELLHSAANDRTFVRGRLETPTLATLQERAATCAPQSPGAIRVREVVADVRELHRDPAARGALFQAASQFNLLEMMSPSVTPSRGITGYVADSTQGPACAVSCAAATLYRNWFAQTSDDQIDTLAGVGASLGNGDGRYWTMRNGYALLTGNCPPDVPAAHGELRIGLQWETEVTLAGAGHLVSQAFCSALPISYSQVRAADVEPLARLVLNSSYIATLAAATVNAARPGGSNVVYLTLLGGGAFGNPVSWIVDAMASAFDTYADVDLDVRIVSHTASNPRLQPLLR